MAQTAQAGYVLCVRGSGRHAWVPVPVVVRGGTECVTLSSCSTWAHRVLNKTKRDDYSSVIVIKAFDKAMREQLRAETCAAAGGPEDETVAKASLFSDDETDGDDEKPSACSQKDRKRDASGSFKSKGVGSVGFTTLSLDGKEIKLGVYKGPGLQLPAQPDAVRDILNYLDKHYGELLTKGRGIVASSSLERAGGPQELLRGNTGVDTNRIRYDFKRSAFQITYGSADGTTHRISKGFEVPRLDFAHNVLPKDEYAKVKAAVLQRARASWDELDKSERPRYGSESKGVA